MALREPYKGYVLQAYPVRRAGRWTARVLIELHQAARSTISRFSRSVYDLSDQEKEAEQASIQFGKALLDSRPSNG